MSLIKNWNLVSTTLLIFLAIWIFFCFWFPLTDTDIWWHLAAAKWMWIHHAFPYHDPFCFSSQNVPWINLHWGFQLITGLTFFCGGAFALILFKCLMMTFSMGLLLWPHWNKSTAYLLFPLTLLGTFLIRYFIDVRPLLITLFFLSAQYALIQFNFRGKIKSEVWLVLPLVIGLANVQGLFYLGSFLITILIGAEFYKRNWQHEQKKSLLFIVGLSWVCPILNPYGWQGIKLPFLLWHRIEPLSQNIFSDQIAENEPWIHYLKANPSQLLPWLLFISAVLYVTVKNFRRTSLGPMIIFLAFTLLGFMAIRNLPLVVLAGIMLMGQGSDFVHNKLMLAQSHLIKKYFASFSLALVFIISSSLTIFQAWEYEIPNKLESPFRFPSSAVQFLKTHPLDGQMFNELRYGGYVDYYLYPNQGAFIDGRMILHTSDFFEEYLAAVDHPEKFSDYRVKYGISFVMLPISEKSRFVSLCQYLLYHEKWQFGFCDGASVILIAPELPVTWALPLHSKVLEQFVNQEIENRFGSNLKLERIARKNVEDLLLNENEINKISHIP